MSPIRPENRHRYPPDWPAISLRIRRDRAHWRCECAGQCGRPHATRDGRCLAMQGDRLAGGHIVILTVAHLDDTPEHCDDANLLAMCQRCHLLYDRHLHSRNRSLNRDAATGQLAVFAGEGYARRAPLWLLYA